LILTRDAVGSPTVYNMTENTFNLAINMRSGNASFNAQMDRYFRVNFIQINRKFDGVRIRDDGIYDYPGVKCGTDGFRLEEHEKEYYNFT